MRKRLLLTVFIALGAMMLSAQNGRMEKGQNPQQKRLFDKSTVETFTAMVQNIQTIARAEKKAYGIHLDVKNEQEEINVHLGPAWYLDDQKFQFSKGDELVITGSRITYVEKPAIIATKIEKNGEILELRDDDGFPHWRGLRKGSGKGKRSKL
ncbi:hypothetical protein [uncultured Croceitalea sp.]|uniref:hypothetical protein n=1 Tax=uncultured Croceitalea sp. TaxID=1798908 RepID=UPI003305C599